MRVSGQGLSRSEVGLIAAALLLPVPLVALNGYGAALPDALERGLGSLMTLEADGERSRVEATDRQVGEIGTSERGSADAAPAIARAAATPSADDKTVSSGSATGEAAPSPRADDAGATPEIDVPGETDDTGGSDTSSGDGADPRDVGVSTDTSSDTSGDSPGLSLTIGGEGTGTGVSAGSSGADVQPGADSASVGSGEPAAATVGVTDTEGSTNDVGLSVPGAGSAIP